MKYIYLLFNYSYFDTYENNRITVIRIFTVDKEKNRQYFYNVYVYIYIL